MDGTLRSGAHRPRRPRYIFRSIDSKYPQRFWRGIERNPVSLRGKHCPPYSFLCRPTIFNLHLLRVLVPYCVRYIPRYLRQTVAPWIAHAGVQKLRNLINTLDQQSKHIYYDKKAALEKGDETAMHQMREARDVLSVLGMIIFQSECRF